jgi:hypothetical protein
VVDLRTDTVVARLDTGGTPFWIDDSAGTVLLGKNVWPSDSMRITEYNLASGVRRVVSCWPVVIIHGAIDYGNAVTANTADRSYYCPVASLYESPSTLLPLASGRLFSPVDVDLHTRKCLTSDGSVYVHTLDSSAMTLIIAEKSD